jgi:hypothetical protein
MRARPSDAAFDQTLARAREAIARTRERLARTHTIVGDPSREET